MAQCIYTVQPVTRRAQYTLTMQLQSPTPGALLRRALPRLCSVYLSAFAIVLEPRLRPRQRALAMWVVSAWALRRPVPVLSSALLMWLGERAAVRRDHTWSYREAEPGGVAPWLLPLWCLAAQFVVDAADASAARPHLTT